MRSVACPHMPLTARLVALLLGLLPWVAHASSYLVDFGGSVRIERNGTPIPPNTGMTLDAGDRLQTLDEGWLLIGFTERAALHLASHAHAELLAQEEKQGALRVHLDSGVVRLATEVSFDLIAPEGVVSAHWANLVLKSGGTDAGIAAIEGEVTVHYSDGARGGPWPLEMGQWRALSRLQGPSQALDIPPQWLAGIGPELTPCGCGDVLNHLLPDPSSLADAEGEEQHKKPAIAPPELRALPMDQMMRRDRPLSRPMVVPR